MAKKKSAEAAPEQPTYPRRRRRGLMGKVDNLISWAGRVAKGKDLTTTDKAIVGSLVAISAAYVVRGALAGRSSLPVLNASDPAMLKSVFFSGEPWLVECTGAGKPSPSVFEAEKALAAAPSSDLKMGLLDCGAALPSGKTTLERFKLSPPAAGPTVLLFANQEPKPAMATGALVVSGQSMLRWAATTSKPKVQKPSSTETLEKHCLKKKWCVLVFTAVDRPSDAERTSLGKLAKGMRDVKFVTVDSSKYTMRLELPDPSAPPPEGVEGEEGYRAPDPINLMPTKSRSAVVLLKPAATGAKDEAGNEIKGSAAMALAVPSDPTLKQPLDDGIKDAASAIAGIRKVIEAAGDAETPAGFTLLKEAPTLRTRRSRRRRANNPPSSSSSSSGGRTLSDAELREMREARANADKERLEKERLRREAMAAEADAADNLVEDVADGDDGGMYEADEGDEGDDEGDDEVEEEEMEFDD